jgi:hypothetical protein
MARHLFPRGIGIAHSYHFEEPTMTLACFRRIFGRKPGALRL